MVASDELRDLTGLLHEYAERTGATVHLGVKDGNTWVQPSELPTGDGGRTYDLEFADVEDRYRMVTDDDEGTRVVGRKRLIFSMPEFDREKKPPRQLVVDLSHDEAEPLEDPLHEEAKFVVPAAALEKDGEFAPVRVNRVAGLDEEKSHLKNFLKSDDEDWGLSEPTGLLLEGPPGTGKTELVMEVCEEVYGSIPVTISGPEILSKWVGESERLLREKFTEARRRDNKVLYIDELDAIARSRSEASESYSAQLVAQLLVLLDGVESKEQRNTNEEPLKVVASTNLAKVVDPALRRPGRLGGRPIQFRRPGPSARTAILHHYLEQVWASEDGRLHSDLKDFISGENPDAVSSLVTATRRFTGAEIEDVVQNAVQRMQDEEVEADLTIGRLQESAQSEQGTGMTEKTVATDEVHAVDERDVDPGSYYLAGEDPEEVAKAYFRRRGEDDATSYLYRTLEIRDMLQGDVTQTRETVAHAFQHHSNEEVTIYIPHAEQLARTQTRSSQVDALVGVLNEQFLRWCDDVLLILSGPDDVGIVPTTNP